MKRLVFVMSVVLSTVVLFKLWMLRTVMQARSEASAVYFVCSLLSIAVYLPSVAWLSLLIGIRIRSQARAIFTTVTTIVAWCAIPIFAVVLLIEIADLRASEPWILAALASPAMIIPFNEFNELNEFGVSPWATTAINFAFHGALMLTFRYLCLYRAQVYLGRCETDQEKATSVELHLSERILPASFATPHES
jgi:hypothetical protein